MCIRDRYITCSYYGFELEGKAARKRRSGYTEHNQTLKIKIEKAPYSRRELVTEASNYFTQELIMFSNRKLEF